MSTDSTAAGTAGRRWLLAIDTGTSRIVVAAGEVDGRLIEALDWPAGHRHGERLLPGLEELLAVTGLDRAGLAGIVVGTGPGAFTGLRVGLATAKTLAHASGIPIVGVGTGEALAHAAAGTGEAPPATLVLLLPAGPRDRVELRVGHEPRLLPGGMEPALGPGDAVVAVDLAGRAPEAAVARGELALAGLPAAIVRLGAARLAAGAAEDPAGLIPEYVSLPRGVRATGGEIEWSHGPR
ncbi:MAG TPA: tRNA (adenosine(37)-N6)-threonylcarbamoyltransferase complex dimerization subunit type 1 TsaB [Candidatus Limnocylindrales bacterium]